MALALSAGAIWLLVWLLTVTVPRRVSRWWRARAWLETRRRES